jgi:arsenite-transporting ATPase
MTAPAFLNDRRLQLLIFGGKGGVGKTTCATATALHLAKYSPQLSFLLVSTDPAHSLADSLAGLIPPRNLQVLELDASEYLAAFKKKHGDQLREIAAQGTFLSAEEINRFLDLSLPGLDELMAFLEISAWVESRRYDEILVDTAPSGHTLRLLAMPEFFRKWLDMLDALLAKHRYMKWAFAHSRQRDELDAFLEDLGALVKRMQTLLLDPGRCLFIPIMLAEAMSVQETVTIVREVRRLKLPITDIVINRLYPENPCAVCADERVRQSQVLHHLLSETLLSRFALWLVPLYAEEVRGQQALESFWDQVARLTQASQRVRNAARHLALRVEASAPEPSPESRCLIFAGKGGVGKTTLACATALHLAENHRGKRVLLFSTGPAHGLSSCLERDVDSRPRTLISGLSAMEIDSQAEFEALKKQYAADVEKFLRSLSHELDFVFDREVLERTLDLSPPGLDEVMGLTRVMALLASGDYDVLVLDSAATGHLVRLLELPEIIDQWLKVFFDLFLKYQQVFRLTRFSQELVAVSKNLKKFRALLSNPAEASLFAVSIPTDMAYEETRDLAAACERLQIEVAGLFLNLVTPPSECALCSVLCRRESVVRNKFRRSLADKGMTVVYRRGELRGLERLGELGEALYQSTCVASRAYA